MKLPDENFTIFVGPIPYHVCFDEGWAANSGDFATHLGQTQEIILDPRIRTDQYRDVTFLHELLHAISFVSGLNALFGDKEIVVDEEAVVEHFAPWLYMVLRDNPEIF